MAVQRKIVDATLIIDNNVVGYVPNTLKFTEGFGEQSVRVQTGGGGSVQQVVADDVSMKQSSVMFEVEPTAANISLIRSIKNNQDGHVITISTTGLTRTITGAVLTSNYEVSLGTEETIQLEFIGNPSV
jgi:hypothetical protein